MGAVAFAAGILASSLVLASGPEGEDLTTFRVEEADLDLGTVIAGNVATATFVFRNDGPDDVHIIRAKPS
jgi:hypothetical protein